MALFIENFVEVRLEGSRKQKRDVTLRRHFKLHVCIDNEVVNCR